jgi:hypothetical protein
MTKERTIWDVRIVYLSGISDVSSRGEERASTVYQGGTARLVLSLEEPATMNIDPATLLFYLQLLEPVLSFLTSFSGVFLQLLFLGLDFGSFFLGFI